MAVTSVLVDTMTVVRALHMLRHYADDQDTAGWEQTAQRAREVVTSLHDAYIAATGEEP